MADSTGDWLTSRGLTWYLLTSPVPAGFCCLGGAEREKTLREEGGVGGEGEVGREVGGEGEDRGVRGEGILFLASSSSSSRKLDGTRPNCPPSSPL